MHEEHENKQKFEILQKIKKQVNFIKKFQISNKIKK